MTRCRSCGFPLPDPAMPMCVKCEFLADLEEVHVGALKLAEDARRLCDGLPVVQATRPLRYARAAIQGASDALSGVYDRAVESHSKRQAANPVTAPRP